MAASMRHAREPTEEEIRKRAYQLYQERGREPGRDQEDWDRARRELMEPTAGSRSRRLPQRGASAGAQPSPDVPKRKAPAKKPREAPGTAKRPRSKN